MRMKKFGGINQFNLAQVDRDPSTLPIEYLDCKCCTFLLIFACLSLTLSLQMREWRTAMRPGDGDGRQGDDARLQAERQQEV